MTIKKRISQGLGLVLAAALLLGGVSASMTAARALEAEIGVMALEVGGTLTLGNEFIQRNFIIAGSKVATASIVNKRSGNTLVPGAGSEDFIISVTNQFETNVDATLPERQIKTSDLTLAGSPAVTNVEGASRVVFNFEPIVRLGIPWTIAYVIMMADGDHYMNSWLEIGVPEEFRETAHLHTVDVDAFNIGSDIPDELLWTRLDPKQYRVYNQFISSFQQSSGQPLYVNGLFFGVEFQVTSNDILPYPNAASAGQDKNLLMRYYSGKSFERLADEGRLNEAGRFVTWPAVVGAARSGDYQVVQDDFYDYVNEISQGTYFRTQFNTWYDGGMNITPASLTTSYMNIEQGLTQAGLPPISAYICDDGYNDYSAPFWGFKPSFANNVLKEISQMVTDAGGAFAKWISPRGGYGQSQSPFMAAAGTGYRSVSAYTERPGDTPLVTYRGEICAAAPIYLQNMYDMFTFNMDEYNVNYWKLDGMARSICRDPRHGHMVGGIVEGARSPNTGGIGSIDTAAEGNDADASSMWFFTELWENYNALFLAMRDHQEENGKGLWLNSTGTSVPSPWYLMVVNSIKVITSPDSGKTGPTTFPGGGAVGDGERRLTFRDSGYWRFFNHNQYQFPFHYIWNHDPIYALGNDYVEMSPQSLRANLYGNAMRGNRVWELLFSPAIFTDAHWLITNETINFAKDNMDVLGNVRMITDPRYNNGEMGQANNDSAMTPYMMSAWGDDEGFVSFRNTRSGESVELTLTLDRLIGAPEDMADFSMTYVLPSEVDSGHVVDRKATYDYGDTIKVALGPMEFVILHFSADKDETAPEIVKTEVLDANTLRVNFSEAIELAEAPITITGHTVAGAVLTDDFRNVDITVSDAFTDNEVIDVTSISVLDLSANPATLVVTARYAAERVVSEFNAAADLTAGADVTYNDLLQSDVLALDGNATGFASGHSADLTQRLSVAALIKTTDSGAAVLAQDGAYSVSINAEGKVEFTVGGLTVQSKQAINDGAWHHFACVKEPNEMIKVYIDGKISASTYDGYNLNILRTGAVAIGSAAFTGELSQIKIYNDSLGYMDVGKLASQPLAEYDLAGYNAFTVVGLEPSLPDTVQARYDATGYYVRLEEMPNMPGADRQARFELSQYFRNYDAAWNQVDEADYAATGKVEITGTLPGLDGDKAISGNLSVLPEWPASWSLSGTDLEEALTEMEEGGWEIIGRNDANLSIADNGLTIRAARNKVDRGNIDAYDPDGMRILDGSPNPNYDPDADPGDVNYVNSQREFLDNVQNENFFVIDPGLDDYTITISGNIRADQLNKSAGLIIRVDDDNYVRMTYRVSGCTGNSTRAAMSLNVHVDGEELTLEESPGARIGANDIVELALEKKGNYYTGYYRTADSKGMWMKVGTVKAEMDSPKAGFYAALGVQSLTEHGFTSSSFAPRFTDFTVRQYSVGLTIAEDTAGVHNVDVGDPSPRYAWAHTTFSDGSKGALLVELPEIDTSEPATLNVQGTVAGHAGVTVPVTVHVGALLTGYTVSFETNGGTAVAPIIVEEGGTIDTAPVSTKEGLELEGWYADEELTEKVEFPYTVTEDITLYAKWESVVVANIRVGATSDVEQPIAYTISLKGMKRVMNARIYFEVDTGMLTGDELEMLSSDFAAIAADGKAIRWTDLGDGIWQGEFLLLYLGGGDGLTSETELDIAKLIFSAKKLGSASVKLTGVVVSGLDEDGIGITLNSRIGIAEATTSVIKVYSKYDLNQDGVVDERDLAMVQRYYQVAEGHANWEAAKVCDFNNDKIVDMLDILELFLQFT